MMGPMSIFKKMFGKPDEEPKKDPLQSLGIDVNALIQQAQEAQRQGQAMKSI